MNYLNCGREELEKEYAALTKEYEDVKGKGLKLEYIGGEPELIIGYEITEIDEENKTATVNGVKLAEIYMGC